MILLFFYLFVEHAVGSGICSYKVEDENLKISKKDPRYLKIKLKKRVSFRAVMKKKKNYNSLLDLLYIKFFIMFLGKKAVHGACAVSFVFVKEYQKFLKSLDKAYHKTFYFMALYAEMVRNFRFLVKTSYFSKDVGRKLDYFTYWN